MALSQKLHPTRFSDMSPLMAFLVGSILGEKWVNCPRHGDSGRHLSITSDGFLMTCQGNCFICRADDFERNLSNLLDVAELTDEEQDEWDSLYSQCVTDWRTIMKG